ncbi:MAG: AmmeMemoRadiSam system protein A [Povalibacter sp.]
MSFNSAQRLELLQLARGSIVSGLRERRRTPAPQHYSAGLEIRRASFVTLRIGPALRGCCGAIEAREPIAEDVWRNAWASAFNDPRFPPLTFDEYARCTVSISVLSELEPVPVANENELLQQLRPGLDGLLLRAHTGQATFLPAVWKQLRDPVEFVHQLKMKAGWPADYWSADMQVYRYTTESFGESGEEDSE